jgi:leucyl-tRNA synthetase
MDERYIPEEVEAAAQRHWEEGRAFEVVEEPGREKFYCLSMFPYPSGRLHMGHVRNYTIGDVIARYQRMLGKNVLQPMGWDAFGLPAENAALKNQVPPARWTYQNIDDMRRQLKRLGFGYDWRRELATCRPEYYRWEQWLFTRLMNKGLAYKRMAEVNWDPVDQTVLANEQVIDGRGWRSGALVERREIPQWFLRITAYADELLSALDKLRGWPEAVRIMQRNWIGRSQGVEMDFAVEGAQAPLRIYTTRPDTLMGVTYVAVAAEHPLALQVAASKPGVAAFIEEFRHTAMSEAAVETLEKRGIPLGLTATHPVSGEEIPIFAANFVLMSYGTGGVMAVPAHDQRDYEFAQAYGLPIRQVVFPNDGQGIGVSERAFTDKGVLRNSGEFDGLTSEQAFEAIAEYLTQRGLGGRTVNYRLRDWGVSRQRYWGAPIPVVNCPRCGAVAVPDKDLPVVLPEDLTLTHPGSPLKDLPEFVNTPCPGCGGPGERETDTFDTFMESSWYYARYATHGQDRAMLDDRANHWLPVDQYVGGIEHAVLHLLYARFYHKLLRDEGLVSSDEPFTRLLTQGMVVAETYHREDATGNRRWYNPADVDVVRDDKGRILQATLKTDGQEVIPGGVEKMSKSRNNGVDPQALIDRYGADTVRLYTMFTAPPDQSLEWLDEGVEGAYRFIKRLWALAAKRAVALRAGPGVLAAVDADQQAARRDIHETLKKALFDYERQQYNTVVSACMSMVNTLYKLGDSEADRAVLQEGFGIVLRLLAPIAPHVTHHLWRTLGYGEEILEAGWPQADEAALEQDTVELVVQVNGKLRARIVVPVTASREEIEALALGNEKVARFLLGKPVRRVILVPGKLVNIVA